MEVEWRRAASAVVAEAKAQVHQASVSLKQKKPAEDVDVPKGVSGRGKTKSSRDHTSVNVGDTVYIERLNKSAKVLEVSKDTRKVVLQAGPLKLTVPIDEITK